MNRRDLVPVLAANRIARTAKLRGSGLACTAKRETTALACAVLAVCATACRPASPSMAGQPRLDDYAASTFFADGGAARQVPAGTVARVAACDAHTPRVDERLRDDSTSERVDAALIARGRDRFAIWCTPCHDWSGGGEGTVVRRGYPQPPAFTDPRLLAADDAHFLDVITRGLGKMPPYGPTIAPADRRAIVAWIRVLQRSQHARIEDAPPAVRARLLAAKEDER